MICYRISRDEFIKDLSGKGAKLYGGRWNRIGIASLYTGSYRSLALLEMSVHLQSKEAFALPYSFACIEIEDKEIFTVPDKMLPQKWNHSLSYEQNFSLTDYLFTQKNVLAFSVPSVIIHEEKNIIINPLHPAFSKVKLIKTEKIRLDERLIAK